MQLDPVDPMGRVRAVVSHKVMHYLCKHGNGVSITIPRFLLFQLGWVVGQGVIVQLLEDNSVHIRLPNEQDFGPTRPPRLKVVDANTVKA